MKHYGPFCREKIFILWVSEFNFAILGTNLNFPSQIIISDITIPIMLSLLPKIFCIYVNIVMAITVSGLKKGRINRTQQLNYLLLFVVCFSKFWLCLCFSVFLWSVRTWRDRDTLVCTLECGAGFYMYMQVHCFGILNIQ